MQRIVGLFTQTVALFTYLFKRVSLILLLAVCAVLALVGPVVSLQ